jgi:hypothetical protein
MVCVDLLGPFTIRKPAKTHSLIALTMIDPAISQDLFHNTWLAHYPQPQFIVFDNGITGKFKYDFKKCVIIVALKPKQLLLTTYQSQANAMIERVHKVVNDILRSFDLENNH